MESKSNDEKRLNRKKQKNFLRLKKSRIILRNLSFKANEDIIREKFRQFGDIVEVIIPKKSDGKMFGFCFIGFDSIKSALKAIKSMNGTELFGRTIALDFALAKKKFQDVNKGNESEVVLKTEDMDSDNESNGEETEPKKEIESDGEEDETDEGMGEESDDYGSDDEKKFKKPIDPKILNDATEERTVFVRNLSFASSAEALNEVMKRFGETEYCKLCVDKVYEHSKGTAFVKFRNKLDAKKCLEANDSQNSDLLLDGRQLNVSLAVTRNQLKDLHEKRLMKDKDKRNLYLAKEGLIYPESPAAEGVSQSDLSKRLALETRKRKMLQNNHFFVSQNRLCVHNIPFNYDNQKLRTLFKSAVNDKNAKIVEARVMFDIRKSDQKFGKSKGFGFVEFAQHIHALHALRHLNNNPTIFGSQKRPIVEFSIENKVALNKKKHRMNANLAIKAQNDSQNVTTSEEPTEESVDYSGVQSRPNKQNEKIKAPKVNRKLGEMQKKLKTRGKKLQKNRMKANRGLKHKEKEEKQKAHKRRVNETQDSHDLHYRKRKNIFKDTAADRTVPKPKKVKWFTQ